MNRLYYIVEANTLTDWGLQEPVNTGNTEATFVGHINGLFPSCAAIIQFSCQLKQPGKDSASKKKKVLSFFSVFKHTYPFYDLPQR